MPILALFASKLILASLVPLLSIFSGPSIAFAQSTTDLSISSKGENRKAYLYFPNNKIQEGLPAVIIIHGGGGNASGMIRMTGMNEKSDEAGFVAVYPEGNPAVKLLGSRLQTWNAGRCCGSAVEDNKDDVSFISDLIDDLVKKFRVDRNRIYVTGMSNGAQLAYRLACQPSEKIAAIAPVASAGVFEPCTPSRLVPTLHIHGTDDPCALYNGGSCGGCFQELLGSGRQSKPKKGSWACSSVPEFIEGLRERRRCTLARSKVMGLGATRCEISICDQNVEIALCTIEGAGHTWPGGNSPLSSCQNNSTSRRCARYEAIVGKTSNDINANDLIWDFFKTKYLPEAKGIGDTSQIKQR